MHAHGHFVFAGGLDGLFQIDGVTVHFDLHLCQDRFGNIRGGDGTEGFAALTDGQIELQRSLAEASGSVLRFGLLRVFALGALGLQIGDLAQIPGGGLVGFALGNEVIARVAGLYGDDVRFRTEGSDFLFEDDLNVGHKVGKG